MRVSRGIAALAVALPLLAACGGAKEPGPSMSTLTTALETGTFTKVDFVAKTDPAVVATDYSNLTGNLFGKLGAPDVSATKPVFSGHGTDSAKSTLTWAWGLPGGRWTYESEVELRKTDEKWEFVWEPTVVAP